MNPAMIKPKQGVEVSTVVHYSEVEITRVYNEKWITNYIYHSGVQKPGLALAGYTKYLDEDQLQIFGKTEIGYLKQLPKTEFDKCLKNFLAKKYPVLLCPKTRC